MKILSIAALSALLFSCDSVYFPNSHNVPVLEKKGEVRGHFSILNGNNLHATVAATNHIGIMVNGLYANTKDKHYSYSNRYLLGELGVGYFSHYNRYYFNVFGGYGVGKSTSTDSIFVMRPNTPYDSYTFLSSATFNRYFIQPSFGFKVKYFETALACRLSLLDFKNGVKYGGTVDFHRSPVAFLEPAVTGKFTYKKLILSTQAGFSTPLNTRDLYFDYIPFYTSVGIGFRLGYTLPEK